MREKEIRTLQRWILLEQFHLKKDVNEIIRKMLGIINQKIMK